MLHLVAAAIALATTQAFPDTPEHHWVFEAMACIKSQGLLAGYPDGLCQRPQYASRYELAVAFHAAYSNLKTEMDSLRGLSVKMGSEPAGSKDARKDLKEMDQMLKLFREPLFQRAVAYLPRLQKEFGPELRALGVEGTPLADEAAAYTALMAQAERHAGKDLGQFPDVPAGHWAAKAVLELRQAGILQGYPDGDFKG